MIAACPFPAPRGTQISIDALAAKLAQAGHQIHLVSYALPGASKRKKVQARNNYWHHVADAPFVACRSGWQWPKTFANWALYRVCQRLLARVRFDVVHAHHLEGLAIGVPLRQRWAIPLVAHMHTDLASELPTYGSRPYFGRRLGTLAAHLERRLLRRADHALAFNYDDAVRLSACVKTQCIYPALTQAAASSQAARGTSAPYLIYSGNTDGYQGLDFLLAAWPRIYARLPHYRLIIATHQAEPVLAAQKACAGVQQIPVDSFAHMQALIRAANLAVCTRQIRGGFPIKWLNYWSLHIPMVAVETTGQSVFGPDFQARARDYAFWSAPCVDAFVHTVVQAANNPTGQRMRIEKAKTFVERMHTTYVPAVEQAYQQAENIFKRTSCASSGDVNGF